MKPYKFILIFSLSLISIFLINHICNNALFVNESYYTVSEKDEEVHHLFFNGNEYVNFPKEKGYSASVEYDYTQKIGKVKQSRFAILNMICYSSLYSSSNDPEYQFLFLESKNGAYEEYHRIDVAIPELIADNFDKILIMDHSDCLIKETADKNDIDVISELYSSGEFNDTKDKTVLDINNNLIRDVRVFGCFNNGMMFDFGSIASEKIAFIF